ncbi:SPT3 Dosage dependent suppressor of Ty-induced promoter mutations-like protein [Tulasnella sp. JGI-2019a]|nr:SPT3 Dosage dependent suppressor of Ty-induced promoter mutations-like protein [Tulasnella sp. JGI-2019a]KAG9035626.1 SPT3 Dosage dependent suppressor of Ty-induced promoter mutations-like protein [Tulasnella sp. JGI-2019a]
MTTLLSRSRSSSPPSSSNDNDDSPPSSYSSPDSFVFHSTDGAQLAQQSWKSYPVSDANNNTTVQLKNIFSPDGNIWSNGDYDFSALAGAAGNAGSGGILKAEDDNDGGAVFSQFIQEDAFDPTPLPIHPPHSISDMNDVFASSPIKSGNAKAPSTPHRTSNSPIINSYPNTLNLSQAYPAYQRQQQPPPILLNSSSTINPQYSQQPQYVRPPQAAVVKLDPPPVSEVSSAEQHQQLGLDGMETEAPIYPNKASCLNLPIYIGNVPERGAKSRVETQIKMDLDLMMPTTPSQDGSSQSYRRVASWKWLRLNKGATTKRRPKKDVKQEALTDETLYLSTEVICATTPNLKVHSCTNCIQREAKRLERKKATRVRPVRDVSESEDEATAVPRIVQDEIRAEEEETDDLGRIVLFNCHELVDISTGTASLPVRITCYCRHHREKVGFRVIFTMRDAAGRIVGRGTAPPIMITDDHKSTQKNSGAADDDEDGEEQPQPKRKRRAKKDVEVDGDVNMDDDDDSADPSSGKVRRKSKSGTTSMATSRPGSAGGGAPPSSGAKKPTNRQGTISGRSSRKTTPSRRSSPPAGPPMLLTQPVPHMVSRSSIQMSSINPSTTNTGYPTSGEIDWTMTTPNQDLRSSVTSMPSPFDFNAMAAFASMPVSAGMSPQDSTNTGAQSLLSAPAPNPGELDAVLASMIAMVGNGGMADGTQTRQQSPSIQGQQSIASTTGTSPVQHFQPLQNPYSPNAMSTPVSPSVINPNTGNSYNTIQLDSPMSLIDHGMGTTDLFPQPSRSPANNGNMAGPDFLNLLAQYPNSLTTQPPAQPSTVTAPQVPAPMIHRLIPSSGPMHGGIEVTILGANFRPSHECVFGDTLATSTQMWSENTIVCILPPSPSPGPVVVGFKGVPLVSNGGNGMEDVDGILGLGMGGAGNGSGTRGLQLFTYLDNSDRALMELALQVVGLKMTGRIEEAKNVAMRIVGTNSGMDMSGPSQTSNSGGNGNGGNQMSLLSRSVHHHSPSVSRIQSSVDLASMLTPGGSGRQSRDFQSVIIEFLNLMDVELDEETDGASTAAISVMEAISHPNPTGQTLLHLACILGFHRLVSALVSRGIDVDARDRNGFTALHFAAACGRLACARVLVEQGHADLEVVDGRGRSATQVAFDKDQADVHMLLQRLERRAASPEYEDDESDSEGVEHEAYVAIGPHDDHDVEYEAEEDVDDDEVDDDDPWTEGQTEDESGVLEISSPVARLRSREARQSRLSSAVPSRVASRVAFVDSPREPGSDLYSSHDEAEDTAPTPRDLPNRPLLLKDPVELNEKVPSIVDASSAWLHRTLAQLQPPPAMVPDVPWLQNIQIPAFQMQMPTLPWQGGGGSEKSDSWRVWGAGYWSEKMSPRSMTQHQPLASTDAVPMYTPNADEVATPTSVPLDQPVEDAAEGSAGPAKALIKAKLARRLGFLPGQVTDREIYAYAYYSRKMRKLKQDRMLVLFWLPILLIVIAWIFYESVNSLPVAFSAMKGTIQNLIPLRNLGEIAT